MWDATFLSCRLQIDALRVALQQVVHEWGCFERNLREVCCHTSRVQCSLKHPPLFSLKQAQGHVDILQVSKHRNHQPISCLVSARKENVPSYFVIKFITKVKMWNVVSCTATPGTNPEKGRSLGICEGILSESCEDCWSGNSSASGWANGRRAKKVWSLEWPNTLSLLKSRSFIVQMSVKHIPLQNCSLTGCMLKTWSDGEECLSQVEERDGGAEEWADGDQADTFPVAAVLSPVWSMLPSPAPTVASVGGAVEMFTWAGHTRCSGEFRLSFSSFSPSFLNLSVRNVFKNEDTQET